MTVTPALVPYWRYGDRMSLALYVNEDAACSNATIEQQSPAWEVKDILYGDTGINYQADLELAASASVQNNGTLYAHAVFTRNGYGKHPKEDNYDADNVAVVTWPLTYYVRYRKPDHVKKLVEFPHKGSGVELTAEEISARDQQRALREARESEMDGKLVSYWYPNLTLAIVDSGMELYPYSSEPPVVHKWIKLADVRGKDPQSHLTYMKPIFFVNDFWRLQSHMSLINETTSALPLHVQVSSLSLWKFRVFCSMDHSAKQQEQGLFGEDLGSSGMDEMKRMLADTNPVLLAITFIVTLLHSLFDFLAFKNDKQDTVGVSIRTMLMNVAFEAVILLYLFDNRGNTSYMILISNTVSVVIEGWKVVRAVDLQAVPAYEAMTEEESSTREYDQIAYKYLSYVAYPLLLVYAIYSLFTQEQRSWYSFVLSVLVGYVYTFGFMMMIPQLYINYRLKSVAHMPWRTFAYKALSTFIDDLFSWVMKMPWLHRLATLRDDVVFVVYLYQRWIYRVDHSRANEYGQVGKETQAEIKTDALESDAAEPKKDK
ncbi:cleft lip and palate transmembrane 1 [Linderina pennispora]|uniref:Cleft lip and palate transmembrane 1 n=1 Tax=Linderina pennispora TaxID=61395 RepID=A0A1Y1VXA6_9FUNG|nr:cleft lip and palate transmembrane 1 [Linderina pennispora]ORX65636.1 cleft lip and palate transmembrane 1 [Linderina pennispora]